MLRLLVMGVLVPAMIVASAAVLAGVIPAPVVTLPQPATVALLAVAVAGLVAFKRFRYRI